MESDGASGPEVVPGDQNDPQEQLPGDEDAPAVGEDIAAGAPIRGTESSSNQQWNFQKKKRRKRKGTIVGRKRKSSSFNYNEMRSRFEYA